MIFFLNITTNILKLLFLEKDFLLFKYYEGFRNTDLCQLFKSTKVKQQKIENKINVQLLRFSLQFKNEYFSHLNPQKVNKRR